MPRDFISDERGIRFTISALIAAAVLFGGLTLAFDLAPGQSNRNAIERANQEQLQDRSADFLQVANETGELKDSVLYWDDSEATWVDVSPTGSNYYTTLSAGHPLEQAVGIALTDPGISYNLAIEYQTGSGTSTRRLVYQGTPGANAVIASKTLFLADDDNLVGPDSSETVQSSSSYFAPDAYPASNTYNIIELRVIAWKS